MRRRGIGNGGLICGPIFLALLCCVEIRSATFSPAPIDSACRFPRRDRDATALDAICNLFQRRSEIGGAVGGTGEAKGVLHCAVDWRDSKEMH